MQQAEFGIERGEVDSNAVHRSVKQYKADMEIEKAELAFTIQSEKKELQQIANKKSEMVFMIFSREKAYILIRKIYKGIHEKFCCVLI